MRAGRPVVHSSPDLSPCGPEIEAAELLASLGDGGRAVALGQRQPGGPLRHEGRDVGIHPPRGRGAEASACIPGKETIPTLGSRSPPFFLVKFRRFHEKFCKHSLTRSSSTYLEFEFPAKLFRQIL